MKKYCVYGNPTVDLIKEIGGTEYVAYGGGSYYSSLPLLERNLNVEIYAVYSSLLYAHPIAKYINKRQYSTRTNVFKLEYKNCGRKISVLDNAPSLYVWNAQEDFCYSIVNPVLGEISVNLLRAIRQRSPLLAVDLQGFLRKVENSTVLLKHTYSAVIALELADVVHADLEEFMALAMCSDVREAAHKVSKHLRGIMVITVRPNRVVLVARNKLKVYDLEEAYIAVDKTGAGDYFLSTYTYFYVEKGDEEDAVFRAHEYTTRWLKNRVIMGASRHPHHSVP